MAWEIVQKLNARINRLRALTIASDDRDRVAKIAARAMRRPAFESGFDAARSLNKGQGLWY